MVAAATANIIMVKVTSLKLGHRLKNLSSIKIVLSDKKYLTGFIILTGIIFFVLFQIQVQVIPGNYSKLQARIFGLKDWLFLAVISGLNSLFLVMQFYINQFNKLWRQVAPRTGIASGVIGTSSGIFASIFGTASCALCVSAIFGFLGVNTILFLVNYKDVVALSAVALLLIILITTSQRLNTVCRECGVK